MFTALKGFQFYFYLLIIYLLFITADTGDSGHGGSANTIYRVEEPYFVEDRDLHAVAELRFRL